MFRKVFAAVTIFGFLMMATGCNTIHGLGKDIEKAGEKTQEAADAVKNKM